MLEYLKIWEWERIFGHAVKTFPRWVSQTNETELIILEFFDFCFYLNKCITTNNVNESITKQGGSQRSGADLVERSQFMCEEQG